jgi:hypothetical protein
LEYSLKIGTRLLQVGVTKKGESGGHLLSREGSGPLGPSVLASLHVGLGSLSEYFWTIEHFQPPAGLHLQHTLQRLAASGWLSINGGVFGFPLLHASVEGPCLHRPENWLVRQLNDEPKPVYKAGFIRKERLQLKYCSRACKLVALYTGEG